MVAVVAVVAVVESVVEVVEVDPIMMDLDVENAMMPVKLALTLVMSP